MKETPVTTSLKDRIDKAKKYANQGDILCLHALAQPLVDDLQNACRDLNEGLAACANALEYVLKRIARDKKLQDVAGAGTDTFGRITEAYAIARGLDVHEVRDTYIPGSADIYRDEEEA